MKLVYIYLNLILCIVLLCLTDVGLAKPNPKAGPFTSRVIKLGNCDKPSRAYEKEPSIFFSEELYNTSDKINLMRGNLTILKDSNKLMVRFKGYYMENGKWQIRYVVNNLGCNSPIIATLLSLMGIGAGSYDKTKCSLPKGTYLFDNMDYNQIEHIIWSSKRQYGRMLWRVEVYTSRGVAVCYENETVISPA